MQKITEKNNGIYVLEIYAPVSFYLFIKKFANIKLKPGYYYYAGSAQKNLRHRILRHLKKNKIIHWHIDHLTSSGSAEIKNIFVLFGKSKSYECRLAQKISKIKNAEFILEGFGNSDCSNCPSHLLYSSKRIPQSHFISLYQSTVRFIPSSIETSWR